MEPSFGDANGILGFGNLDMGGGAGYYDAGEHARNMSMSSDADGMYMDGTGPAAGGGGGGGDVPGAAGGMGSAEYPTPIGGGVGAGAMGSSAGDTWQDVSTINEVAQHRLTD